MKTCAILNQGGGAWAFEDHAQRLANALWLEIVTEPAEYNYLLAWDDPDAAPSGELFIPFEAIRAAADKRILADLFARQKVATPKTYLVDHEHDVQKIIEREYETQWVLKYPMGCGGAGHRFAQDGVEIPRDWPQPFVLQKFVQMPDPEVYRLYGIAGELFGWNARRYPIGIMPSPWVAHARGARYVHDLGAVPKDAEDQAQAALTCVGLWDSFGCVDLLCDHQGRWLVLEVGTDGVFNHVDRDVDNRELAHEIERRLALAFWSQCDWLPWGKYGWKLRPEIIVHSK